MITIIDYGLGNIQAFVNTFKRLHIPVSVAKKSDDLIGATKLILPGVGAFDHAMRQLTDSGMRQPLEDLVLNKKVPVLGICVGMQMLACTSDEGELPGLGWIDGHVRSFDLMPQLVDFSLPHMGWNDVVPVPNCQLFNGLDVDPRFYFLHSYFFECDQMFSIATTLYGFDFTCAVANNNIYGVQFHPEKSHYFGMMLLKNFALL